MKRSRTSDLWNYFTIESEQNKTAKCSMCHSSLSFKGTISNLTKHLQNRHAINVQPIQTRQEKSAPAFIKQEQIDPTTEGTNEGASTSSNAESDKIRNHQPDVHVPSRKFVHSTLNRFSNNKKLTPYQRKEIDHALMALLFKSFLPFSTVEDNSFKRFVKSLNPAYQLPSRKHISNVILNAEFQICEAEVKERFTNIKGTCLTLDCWTSQAREDYLAVTAHYLDENLDLKSALLQCEILEESHTLANIKQAMQNLIENWSLQGKVRLVVADNTHNLQNAIKDLQLENFGCFAHTINLVAKSALEVPEVEIFLNKIRSIVNHFRRSTTATEKLTEYQIQTKVAQPKKLIIDVSTRWNSTFDMLERLLVMKEPLTTTMDLIESTTITSLQTISADEWLLCNQLYRVLKPLKDVTQDISCEQYLIGSLVIVFNKILTQIYTNKICNDVTLQQAAAQVAKKIKEGLTTRLCNIEHSDAFAVCTFLDPRFKLHFFQETSAADAARKKVIRLTTQILESNQRNIPTSMEPTPTSSSSSIAKCNQTYVSIWDDIDSIITEVQPTQSSRAEAIDEVRRYLTHKMANRQENPNEWWRNQSCAYPNLLKVYQQYCCIVGTSVPCERIFSKSGDLISGRRARLKPEKVKKLMFLNVNKIDY